MLDKPSTFKKALALGALVVACNKPPVPANAPPDVQAAETDFKVLQDTQVARSVLLEKRRAWIVGQIAKSISQGDDQMIQCEQVQQSWIVGTCTQSPYIQQVRMGEKAISLEMQKQLTPEQIQPCKDEAGVDEDCLTATVFKGLPRGFNRYMSAKIEGGVADLECLQDSKKLLEIANKEHPDDQPGITWRKRNVDYFKAIEAWRTQKAGQENERIKYEETLEQYRQLVKAREEAKDYAFVYPRLKAAWQQRKNAANAALARYRIVYGNWLQAKTTFDIQQAKKNTGAVFRNPPVRPADFEEAPPEPPAKIQPKPTPPPPLQLAKLGPEPVMPYARPLYCDGNFFKGQPYKVPMVAIKDLGNPNPHLDDQGLRAEHFPATVPRDVAMDAEVAKVIMGKRRIDRMEKELEADYHYTHVTDCRTQYGLLEEGRSLDAPLATVFAPFSKKATAPCDDPVEKAALDTKCMIRIDAPRFELGYGDLLKNMQTYQQKTIDCLGGVKR